MYKQLTAPDAVQKARLLSPQLFGFYFCPVLLFQRSIADQAEWWQGHFGGNSSEGRKGSEASAHFAGDRILNLVRSSMAEHCTPSSAASGACRLRTLLTVTAFWTYCLQNDEVDAGGFQYSCLGDTEHHAQP
jgi:hypothetical protein